MSATACTPAEGDYAIPGGALAAIEAKLEIVVRANAELKKCHEARKAHMS